MRVKNFTKLLVLSATLSGVGIAVAGGAIEVQPQAPQSVQTYSGVYIDGNVGYATRDWEKKYDLSSIAEATWVRSKGGFVFGLDVGYQFNQYWAFEAGWEDLPSAKILSAGTTVDKVESWFAYAALKIMVPISQRTFLYLKGGAAYNYNKNRSPVFALSRINGETSNFWSPLIGLGMQYYFTRELSVSFQATYVSGRSVSNTANDRFSTPVAYLYTAAIGYKFMI